MWDKQNTAKCDGINIPHRTFLVGGPNTNCDGQLKFPIPLKHAMENSISPSHILLGRPQQKCDGELKFPIAFSANRLKNHISKTLNDKTPKHVMGN